jgi:hypothetical protein
MHQKYFVSSQLEKWCEENGYEYVSHIDAESYSRKDIRKLFWPKRYQIYVLERKDPLIVLHGDWIMGSYSWHTKLDSK